MLSSHLFCVSELFFKLFFNLVKITQPQFEIN